MATRSTSDKKTAPKADKVDAVRAHALTAYQSALRLMQEGKYDRAHAAFIKLMPIAPPEIAERVRMYLNACAQHLSPDKNTYANLDEHYDYAISLLNVGQYDDARHEFDAILKKNPKFDNVFYGKAVLAAMTSDVESCLQQLAEAIALNPKYRIQARGDSDFQEMFDDPRFTELLYPES
jgi:tetratricopeptide (TPR) repeat protein